MYLLEEKLLSHRSAIINRITLISMMRSFPVYHIKLYFEVKDASFCTGPVHRVNFKQNSVGLLLEEVALIRNVLWFLISIIIWGSCFCITFCGGINGWSNYFHAKYLTVTYKTFPFIVSQIVWLLFHQYNFRCKITIDIIAVSM